jgi:selenide,water dikinase
VDYRTGDDAGVFRLDERTTLVQTVDFFTPVVDDPEAFGAIAAANALSDVYAMGGRPLTALSIAALPEKDFPLEWAAAIVRGGHAKLVEAGCFLLGGHTVRDPEIKFGYAVTGLVDPARMLTNAGAKVGDVMVLTKPLGTGIIATALKAGKAGSEAVEASTLSMSTLNRNAAEVAQRHQLRCATDITGFGLLGHAAGVARESHLSLEIQVAALPILPGALDLAPQFQPGGLHANRRAYQGLTADGGTIDETLRPLLYDPQTSEGCCCWCPPTGPSLAPGVARLPRHRPRHPSRGEAAHPGLIPANPGGDTAPSQL